MNKIKVAIIGSGNIGTDLMIKVMRTSKYLEMGVFVGIDPNSDGLARAQRLGVATTHEGIEGLLKHPLWPEIGYVFDATSAKAHLKNYEKVQMEIKQENSLIALKIRENLKKEGYEFQNKLEDWPKPNETLITIPKQNLQQRIEQITNPTEPKKEEIIKKPSFWDKIRK